MKQPTLGDFEKQHRAIEKDAKALQAKMTGGLDDLDDEQSKLIKLYREFDVIKKKLTKEGKDDKHDKEGIAKIEGLLKQGDAVFNKQEATLAEIKKGKPEAKKLEAEAGTLVKDLDVMATKLGKTKAPDAAKYDSLLRVAKKTQTFIVGDLLRHRGKAVNSERDRKDFEKELTKFIALVREGKHRKSDDDWMTGSLDPAKVSDAEKKLKHMGKICSDALDDIEEKIEKSRSSGEAPELRAEQRVLAKQLPLIDKLWKSYSKEKVDKNAAKETKEGKELLSFLGDLERLHVTLVKRYKATVTAAGKVGAK